MRNLNCLSEKFHHKDQLERKTPNLLEGNILGRSSSTNTGATMLNGLVGNGELAEVATDHLGLKK